MPQRPQIAALITGCLATAPAVASDPGWNFSGLGETHLIVSHPTGSGRGAIQIFHDSSSTPIRTIYSPDRRDLFGVATAGAGDLDGDGFDDVLVGAPLAGRGITNHGMVHAFSAATGLEIMAIPGFGDANYFGRAVASAGDINEDSVPDILVSGWIQSELGVSYGRVYVMCGLDGSVLKTITSFEADDAFGYTIVSLGDLTDDGIPEIAIAAPTAQTNSLGDGAVYIFDLSTRPVKHITTADAAHTIRNDVAAHELFGSVLAYDDLQSTDGYDIVLIGSVDAASYGASPAQFIFSRHRVGYQGVLNTQSTPSITEGDVIPDGKIEDSDVNAVTTNLNQPGTGITTDPDLNGDGIITGSDLVIVLTNYGTVSSLNTMLADPSELVTRVSQLTSKDGGLTVEPGIGEPWTEPICEDDLDDIIDGGGGGGGGGGGRPGIQPGFPGVRPGTDPVIGGGGGPFRSPTLPPADDGEDCPDDDDPDDGCSGCAPEDAEDCDAFANTESPKFVGRGMRNDRFFVELTSDEWSVQLIAPGGVLVKSVGGLTALSPTRFQSSVLFEDEAGEAELTWLAINGSTGVFVSKCPKVQLVNYDPIELVYRTFIPCEAVPGPSPTLTAWGRRGLYEGDSRYICNPPSADFGLQHTSYRTSYRALITCDFTPPINPAINIPPFATVPLLTDCARVPYYTAGEIANSDIPFGDTILFSLSSGTSSGCSPTVGTDLCPLILNGSPPIDTDVLPYNSMELRKYQGDCVFAIAEVNGTNAAFSVRPQANKIMLYYRLTASNPLAFRSPPIDASFELEIEWKVDMSNGRQEVLVYGDITHDMFPAHEMYINGNEMITWDPSIRGNTPLSLFSVATPREENINESFYP